MIHLIRLKKHYITTTIIVILFLIITSLFGCKDVDPYDNLQYTDVNLVGFTKSEMVVEVTAETKSFRIEVEGTIESPKKGTGIGINKDETTAKHNVHFVNTPDPLAMDIGEFIPMPEGKKSYKDVEIMAESITEEVVIVYEQQHKNSDKLIHKLKAILRPTTDKK